ncbi:MAG TPA: right-handed parallel beta-helix repeat-containing protein, partial [Thermoanaerobaculia bacterium]|nr:right-handed parallel beta-helix repeat-containing protein [Thermoanaerobaculia bacterium]
AAVGAHGADAPRPITLPASSTHEAITLQAGQSLSGDGAIVRNLIVADGVTISGITIEGTLTIRGRKGITISGVTVISHDAPALVIADSSVDAAFTRVDVTVAGSRRVETGISLENVTGRIAIDGGTLRNVTKRGISIVKTANVKLSNISLIGSAGANGSIPELCGNALEAGENAKCSAAIYLQEASDIALDRLTIEGSAQTGIDGLEVKNLALTNSEVKGSGNELHEHALIFRNLLGEVRIENCNIHHSASRGLFLHNTGGTSNITIRKSTFSDAPLPATGQQAAALSAAGEAKLDLRVEDSTFARTFAAGLQVDARDRANVAVTVKKSTFDATGGAISLTAIGASSLIFDLEDNIVTRTAGVGINVYRGVPSTGDVRGTIVRNNIAGGSTAPGACTNCDAISVSVTGSGRGAVTIVDNVIQKIGNAAVRVIASNSAQVVATIGGNTVRDPLGTPPAAIRVQAGTSAADTASVCAVIGGAGDRANTIAGPWTMPIELANRFPKTRIRLPGYAGKGTDLAAVGRFVGASNRNAAVRATLTKLPEGNAFEGGEPCPSK